ncbi:MAG: glycosyltransferase family 4 protein [Bacteroidales bacterium]|nr:glycosyltransferase family 4 protein [Bacteroidales bacterium]
MPQLAQRYEVVLLSSPGEGWEEVECTGVPFKRVEVAMERHISPWKDLKALVRLVKVMRRERPAMVHSMTPKAGLLCMMAAWMSKVPVRVHTFTGLVFPTATGMTKKILMATDWLTCACATHVIPEGEGVKQDLLNNGITKKTIKVLGHGSCKGIDLDYFDPEDTKVKAEAEKLRKPEAFTFIFIGRLVGDKGINELVEAFARLNKEIPATRLILVGREEQELDPLKPETLELLDNLKSIEAVGQQTDVRPWLLAADCAVLPSYREGFPNVVLEAGAMGLPQIVTDINGSREIITEGENGTIVPPRSADALYCAMLRMATTPEWRNKLAAKARPLITSCYDHRYVTQSLLDFYDEILCTEDTSKD